MDLKHVGRFELRQAGFYVAHASFMYVVDGAPKMSLKTSDLKVDITGPRYKIDPGELGVPDGSDVTLFLLIVAGTDVSAIESFKYVKGDENGAFYKSSGTTTHPSLALEGAGLEVEE